MRFATAPAPAIIVAPHRKRTAAYVPLCASEPSMNGIVGVCTMCENWPKMTAP